MKQGSTSSFDPYGKGGINFQMLRDKYLKETKARIVFKPNKVSSLVSKRLIEPARLEWTELGTLQNYSL